VALRVAWNLTLDQTKASAATELARRVRVEVSQVTLS
jgi:hypothetical protein